MSKTTLTTTKRAALHTLHAFSLGLSAAGRLLARLGERLWEWGGGLECWTDERLYPDPVREEDTTALPSLEDWVPWAHAHPLLFDEFTPRPMTNPLHALLDAYRYPIIATFKDEEE